MHLLLQLLSIYTFGLTLCDLWEPVLFRKRVPPVLGLQATAPYVFFVFSFPANKPLYNF